jgi:hypothetical protein
MANFATEADVRLRFQLNDTAEVSSALVNASIDDAHTELLRFLDPVFDESPPEDALVMGETLLAGAYLYRSLASRQAFDEKQVAIGGQRIEAGKRFGALMVIASLTEDMAWYVLEPYVVDRPSVSPADVTDTVAVLGEE